MLWSDFYPWVLPSVIGCPNPTLDLHIRQAVIEFCRKTACYTVTLDAITANGTDTQFDLDLPAQTQLVRIMAASVNGRDYPLVDTLRGQQLVRSQSPQDFIFSADKLTVDVWPLRATGDLIGLEAMLTPSHTASQIDSDVISPYVQDIAFGALGSLMLMPAEWGSPNLAVANKGLFKSRIDTVAMHFARGQSGAKLRSFKTYL